MVVYIYIYMYISLAFSCRHGPFSKRKLVDTAGNVRTELVRPHVLRAVCWVCVCCVVAPLRDLVVLVSLVKDRDVLVPRWWILLTYSV